MNRRRFMALGLAAPIAAAPAFGQSTAPLPRSPAGDLNPRGDFVSAADFGAVGDNRHDDTAAIQAAIDYAFQRRHSGIYLPAGQYRITAPLFLDAPGNLRANLRDPTVFNFSLALVGDPGLGNREGFGTRIIPSSAGFVALWVGPGQGMLVHGISIIGPGNVYRNTMPTSGCGIAIAGGKGGASRVLVSNCLVENFSHGIATGFNGNSDLGDSFSAFKTIINNCHRGLAITQAQNYINNVTDCDITGCTIAISNMHGPTLNVRGGNYSSNFGAHKAFMVGTFSAFSTFTDTFSGNEFTNYRFTAVVSLPDIAMQNGTYDRAALNLAGFGVVPLRIEKFETATNVATFSLWPAWLFANFTITFNLATGTDLQVEIAAATTLYACEGITTFLGRGIYARGCHIENPASLTMLIDARGGGYVKVEDFLFNHEISHGNFAAQSGDNLALFICQQGFPFIGQQQGGIVLNDNNFNQSTSEGIVIDIGGIAAFEANRNRRLASPNIRYCYNAPNITGYTGNDPYSAVRGAGNFDVNPFYPTGFKGNKLLEWRNADGPVQGRHPNPNQMPHLTPKQVSEYGALGALGSYVPLCGDAIYAISDWNSGVQSQVFLKSGHQFYSYGQDLTPSNVPGLRWSYKGQSSIVRMDANSLGWMFPGLKIVLNNGADGDQSYVVSEVHKALGYVVVTRIDENSVVPVGAKTTTFTGRTIKQEPYRIRQYP
jgi:hypothetical protein